jgi:hypothetical protein
LETSYGVNFVHHSVPTNSRLQALHVTTVTSPVTRSDRWKRPQAERARATV